MSNQSKFRVWTTALGVCLAVLFLFCACAAPAGESLLAAADAHQAEEHAHGELPELSPVKLGEDEKLRVVVTTNILGDVVKNVGGVQIELTTLLPVGADPHSYNATPEDLRTLSDAHIVFMVGEGVEESIISVLENREGGSALVAVNTGIDLLKGADENTPSEEEHDHHEGDPHTWTAVPNVIHWTEIIEQSLRTLDPRNAETYAANAAAYIAELKMLDVEIESAVAAIPTESRKLVTDHESFGHFAARYGFTVIGSVIPSISTLSSPSAQELAALQQIAEEDVKAIFVGSTTSPDLAEQIASDLGIHVVRLYAESLSAADGPASTYIDFMRYDANAIIEAIR